MKGKPYTAAAMAAFAAALGAGCLSVKTQHEVKPIEINMNINLRIDRELDDYFGDVYGDVYEDAAAAATGESAGAGGK